MDLLIVDGRRIVPVEVKLGTTVGHREVAGLRQCLKDLGLKRGLVVYSGAEPRRLGRDVEIVPWARVSRGEVDLQMALRPAGARRSRGRPAECPPPRRACRGGGA